jgi:membrane-bound lytic murein transglycosylase A
MPNLVQRVHALPFLLVMTMTLLGCAKNAPTELISQEPDYSRQLGPGEKALRLITDPSKYPDLAAAYQEHDELLLEALDQSVTWFTAPSSKQWFPLDDITHDQARASVIAMAELLAKKTSPDAFRAEFVEQFDVYESVGYNGEGIVFFTGYFSPEFKGSRERSDQFRFPLYRRPADLVTDPRTGEPQGRQLPGGGTAPYPTRAEIERTNMLAGTELCWVQDSLAAYIIHVNGSAKLRLPDGSVMHIGYNGKTDRPYASLGKALIEAGLVPKNRMSLKAIQDLYKQDPATVEAMMAKNQSYVFFKAYDGGAWPAGSLGVRVNQERSLATDKKIYPRGGLVLVDTTCFTFSRQPKPFHKFMLDQDTGGAIRAPGRADLYMGVGPSAGILAGQQQAEGRLYYFFLKPQFIEQYLPAAAAVTIAPTTKPIPPLPARAAAPLK